MVTTQECPAADGVRDSTLKEQDIDAIAMENSAISDVEETNIEEQQHAPLQLVDPEDIKAPVAYAFPVVEEVPTTYWEANLGSEAEYWKGICQIMYSLCKKSAWVW